MALPSNSASLSEEIDQLLEHYLSLLEQYTTLRSELSSLQSSVYQNISRANFSAERGVRYGADFYDTRMQATRVCRLTTLAIAPSNSTTGTLAQQDGIEMDRFPRDTTVEVGNQGGRESSRQGKAGTTLFAITAPESDKSAEGTADQDMAKSENEEKSKTRDPLRMFGLLTPSVLKDAQRGSIKVVDDIIPRLATLDAEMKEVEIRIRRARKWKAKAEVKEQMEDGVRDVGEQNIRRVEIVS